MAKVSYTIEQALPHDHPMILLDEVVDWNSEQILTAVTIRPSQPLIQPAGMPAHVAIEYMAQACGAFVGIEALEAGLSAVEVGELVAVGATTVRAWQKDYTEGGVVGLSRKASSIAVRSVAGTGKD